MIKNKIVFVFCLFVLCVGFAHAAPYNMDSPIESYTWGESMKAVLESEKEAGWTKISGDMLMQSDQEDRTMTTLSFWRDKLAKISKSNTAKTLGLGKKEAIYNHYLADFTARWGNPGRVTRCVANPSVCQQVSWNASATTQVTLYQSTEEADRPFVGYAYANREMQPGYEQEVRNLGVRYMVEPLIYTFLHHPEHAEKTLKGKRVRIEGAVAGLMPLTLKHRQYEIGITLQSKQDAASLRQGQPVEISGVITGAENRFLQLSDAFVTSSSEEPELVVNRGKKRPRGFFPAEDFYTRLESAAARMYRHLSLSGYSSPPRLEDRRVVIDYLPNEFPNSLSFSLESLDVDKSSDTIAFNMSLSNEERDPGSYMTVIGVGMILIASQPEQPIKDMYRKTERILENGGKEVINGWTYLCKKKDDRNYTFSATAPARKK